MPGEPPATALEVVMKQCPRARSLGARGYLGFRLAGQCERIVHLLETPEGPRILEAECSECILAELIRVTWLLAPPSLREDGSIRFLVADTPAARRLVERRRDRLVEARRRRLEGVALTPRQREALRMLGEGENIAGLARRLGVSRPAALRLARKTLAKLARIHG